MSVTEKIQLLGAGLYDKIPDELTLKALPTVMELDYVGSEEFDQAMLTKILPKAVEEDIDFNDLLEIDYHWVCRCLRMLNFGPYFTTNAIYCTNCNSTSYGEYQVDLRSVECKPLPEGFTNDIVIPKENFVDFHGDVRLKLPTIRQIQTAYHDKAFQDSNGRVRRTFARMCYTITSINDKMGIAPIEIKLMIENNLSPADYVMLKESVEELTDYGIRSGGITACPKCGKPTGRFIAIQDDRFFRPTVDNLRKWRDSRNTGKNKDVSGTKAANVRKHN